MVEQCLLMELQSLPTLMYTTPKELTMTTFFHTAELKLAQM